MALDADLIQKCADPSLKPAIIETFIKAAGSPDPLAVIVRSGNREQKAGKHQLRLSTPSPIGKAVRNLQRLHRRADDRLRRLERDDITLTRSFRAQSRNRQRALRRVSRLRSTRTVADLIQPKVIRL